MSETSNNQETAAQDNQSAGDGDTQRDVKESANHHLDTPEKKPALRRRPPRKLWKLAVGVLFLGLGIITASQIGKTGEDVEFEELTVKQEITPAVSGDDSDRFGDEIVAMISNAKIKVRSTPSIRYWHLLTKDSSG